MRPLANRCFNWLARWWAILPLAAALSLALAIGAAASVSKLYWGYVLSPPGVDPRVLHATKLLAYAWGSGDTPTRGYTPVGDEFYGAKWPSSPIDFKTIAQMRNTDDTWRLVPSPIDAATWEQDWTSRGVMPSAGSPPQLPAARITTLRTLIETTADPASGSYGNGLGESRSFAQVFQLLGPHGEPLLFVSLHTGELSNDHLAYYELLYDDSTTPPALLDRRQWYYDVAGLEGAEFVPLSIGFSILGLVVTIPVTAVVLLYRRFSKGARAARGHCSRCNYDLRADLSRGCSECGWGAGSATADRSLFQYTLLGRLLGLITRPPRWRTLLFLGVGAVLVWYGRSMPGDVPWAVWWGTLVLVAASLLCCYKAVGTAITRRPSMSVARAILRFATAVLVAGLACLALFTNCPLQVRFALSRSALERVIARERAAGFSSRAPVGLGAVAGLYRVGGVMPTTDSDEGAVVWVGDAGGSPMRGFVWYPGPRPSSCSVYGTSIDLWEALDAHWYLWNYTRKPGKPIGE